MSYIRTEEIKEKQRQKMKKKVLSYDWDAITEKRKLTLEKNGTKVGRKKGEIRPKKGVEKSCAVCNNNFYVTQSRLDVAKYCSRECMSKDPDYCAKLKNVDRSYMKNETYAKATRDPNRPKYKQYQRDVFRLTEENYARDIDLINPLRVPRTLAGVSGGYQLDHITSIRYGFDNGLDPKIIAATENLQMLSWSENIKKGK